MGMPLPTGIELTAVASVAIVLSLAGMWLSRLAVSLINHVSSSHTRSSPQPADRPAKTSSRLSQASAIAKSDWLQLDSREHARHVLGAALNGAVRRLWAGKIWGAGKIWAAGKLSLRQRPGSIGVSHQAVTALPQRISIEAQWERTANVISRAVTGARMARTAHVNAGDKLDAAHYAFDKLLHELEGLISLNSPPAEVAILLPATNVVNLRNPRTVMAARAAA